MTKTLHTPFSGLFSFKNFQLISVTESLGRKAKYVEYYSNYL